MMCIYLESLAGLLWILQFDCIPPSSSVSSLWHSMFAKDSIPHPEFSLGVKILLVIFVVLPSGSFSIQI